MTRPAAESRWCRVARCGTPPGAPARCGPGRATSGAQRVPAPLASCDGASWRRLRVCEPHPTARRGCGMRRLRAGAWPGHLEACGPGRMGCRAAWLLGLAQGHPWVYPPQGRGPARARAPAQMAYAPQVLSSIGRRSGASVRSPWKHRGQENMLPRSRCARPLGWWGCRRGEAVRARAPASSLAHAAAAGSPKAPGDTKAGGLTSFPGGDAAGSRVLQCPDCKMRNAAWCACPLWTRQGYKRSSESPCPVSNLRRRLLASAARV